MTNHEDYDTKGCMMEVPAPKTSLLLMSNDNAIFFQIITLISINHSHNTSLIHYNLNHPLL